MKLEDNRTVVLVADDDPRVRSLLMHTLELGGYAASEVTDGSEVLERVRRGEIPEILLMDVTMPMLGGIDVLKQLRGTQETAQLPVILISAQGDEETMLQGLDSGADDYITKPFRPAVLLAKVRATLRGRQSQTPTTAELTTGSIFEGRYLVQSKLGDGATSVVYRATDLKSRQDVAIKLQNGRETKPGRATRRFHREVLALAKVDHPNVVRIYSAGVHAGRQYYTMQHVAGLSLRAQLKRNGRFDIMEAFLMTAQICDGLSAVHQAGFVHRDLKPGNIFVGGPSGVVIGDFGIVFPVEDEATRLTLDGGLVGTPLYMSPEQLHGLDVDSRSDIYSLGIVLCEMLTGRPARATGAGQGVLAWSKPPRAPRSMEPSLPGIADTICLKAFNPDREQRFQSAEAFAEALREAAISVDWDGKTMHEGLSLNP
jgi:DNA-binding response OmpR family regulator